MISEDAESPEKLHENDGPTKRSRKNKDTFDLNDEEKKELK